MTSNNEIGRYFQPVIGQKPWRARRGVGSFLTFDFGPEVRDETSLFGTWHLWIYQCEWRLESRGRVVVRSESNQHAIQIAVKKLEAMPLTDVSFDPDTAETHFRFGHVELICFPYSDSDFERDLSDTEYWLFYMPDHQVVWIGRDRKIRVGSATAPVQAPA